MKTTRTMLSIAATVVFASTLHAETWTWRKLPGITGLPANWNPAPTSVNVSNGTIYSVVNGTGWSFHMRSNSFQPLPILGWPANLGSDIWAKVVCDSATGDLYLRRDGASYVYRLPATGGTPILLGGSGASGAEYQNMWYWNSTTHSVGRFGGYGFFAVKNWRFEFDVSMNSWSEKEANIPGRGPWGRTARNYALTADGQSVLLYGGDGNSTGNQGFVDPGFLGNGSTTGQMDHLCDLWRLDFTIGTWSNYLAGNNYSYPFTGPIVHFPPLSAVLMVTGTGYTPTNFGIRTTGVAMYRLDLDSGFRPVAVIGDVPDTADEVPNLDGSVYYDSRGQRVLYFNLQGVYELRPPKMVNIRKAVYLDFSNLSVGTNYQLQVSSNLNNWANHGSPFTATNSTMPYSEYWHVENWHQLYFRLQEQ